MKTPLTKLTWGHFLLGCRFLETILLPLMKSAKKENITLLLLDAVHFVTDCDFLGYIYGEVRRFIKIFSGKKRYNVLGARQ